MSWENVAQLVTVKPGDGVLMVDYNGQNVTCAGTLWQEPVDDAMNLWCDAPQSFEDVLRDLAEAVRQVWNMRPSRRFWSG